MDAIQEEIDVARVRRSDCGVWWLMDNGDTLVGYVAALPVEAGYVNTSRGRYSFLLWFDPDKVTLTTRLGV